MDYKINLENNSKTEVKNKILIFDTNIWLNIFSKSNKSINNDYIDYLKKDNQFAIFNVSIIEILMRFKRQKNFKKIREFLQYLEFHIKNEDVIIGNIQCTSFYCDFNKITELRFLTDQKLILEIEKLEDIRFEFKSSIISLWLICLMEILFTTFTDSYKEKDKIVELCNKRIISLRDELIKYFKTMEQAKNNPKSLNKIINKLFNDMFYENLKEYELNSKYIITKSKLENLKSYQSISYLYIGIFQSEFMDIYKQRIDRTLDYFFPSTTFKKIFYLRLESFMQGEPLQRNDVEDMLMLSMFDFEKNLIIVTQDKKMKSFLKDNNYDIGNIICDKIIKK